MMARAIMFVLLFGGTVFGIWWISHFTKTFEDATFVLFIKKHILGVIASFLLALAAFWFIVNFERLIV